MEGQAAKAANLSLVAKAFEGFDTSPPLHIMIFFVLGWVFLFLSHYQVRKQ